MFLIIFVESFLKKNRIDCRQCLTLSERISRLEDQNKSLADKLKRQQRQIDEGYFGLSTPSSKKPPQPNSCDENKNKGGAKHGHVGYGRSSHDSSSADKVIELNFDSDSCPDCGGTLKQLSSKPRSVIDIEPVRVQKTIYHLKGKRCKSCKKHFSPKPTNVMPKFLYGNTFLSWLAIEHYIYGVPLGTISKRIGVNCGSLISVLHKLGAIFNGVPNIIIEKYKNSPVKHADETGWDYDGKSSYAWLFATDKFSIYKFSKTRSASVVEEVLGTERLPGVLVVDRYRAYNKANIDIQYCYAHLLRDVKNEAKIFPEEKEVTDFTDHFSALLANAMSLRRVVKDDKEFEKKAEKIKEEIESAANSQANHAAVQHLQNIFRDNKDKLYHWAENRNIPAENNFAERELRPLIIARKLSYGSRSDEGAKTREILMTVLQTLKKNCNDPLEKFNSILDEYAKTQSQDSIVEHF